MCGIIGYTGSRQAVPFIIEGLKKLEYRGYDSAGLAAFTNGKIERVRAVGKVKKLEEALSEKKIDSTLAIGHTRWATHGRPSETNSHPHTDCSGDIVVVHNGIIENYLSLKADLLVKGHIFKSETDTAVLAHLIEENLKDDDILSAVQKTAKMISGAYAVGVLYKGAPDMLIGLRKQSPLVIGLGKGENFLASDVTAYLAHTKETVFMEDNEIAVLTPKAATFYGADGKIKKPLVTKIKWTAERAEKGGYEHFMLKEIYEQPDTIADTLRFNADDMSTVFGLSSQKAREIKNIQIIACGTAYHAAMAGKYFIERFSDIPVSVEIASEYKYKHIPSVKNAFVIAVSQSGETADTIAALKKAEERGADSLAICNVLGSTLTRIADHTFFTHCGLEISVASTKAFTSQLASLYAFALFLGRETGYLKEKEYAVLTEEFFSLPRLMQEALKCEEEIKKVAKKVYHEKTYLFLGRNALYPLALEGALKLKEISYLNAEGFAAGEIKHGPIAMISKDMPVITLMPKDEIFEKMISACEETKARGASVFAITSKDGLKAIKDKVKYAVALPNTTTFLFSILSAVALQLFAYHIAKNRKREIDQPRNLAKSVTVE